MRYAGRAEPTAARDADAPITVLTFNIQRSERVGDAVRLLRTDPDLRAADVLLLQELDARGARTIARALRMNHVYYPSYRQFGRQSGVAIVSRFPIRSDRAIDLPHPSPLDGRRRRAARATLDAPGGRLRVYSVHAAPFYMSVRGRRAQARHVLEDAARSDVPTVIGGDFNTVEPWSLRRVVQDHRILGFRWATRSIDATADYPGFSLRLDHVFVRDLLVLDAGALRTSASDHRPVWVRLRRRSASTRARSAS